MHELIPSKAIGAIIRHDLEKGPVELLGTGFVVGNPPTLITAKHVFDKELSGKECFGVSFAYEIQDQKINIYNFSKIQKSENYDIAACYFKGYENYPSLKVVAEIPRLNVPIVSYEYSWSDLKPTESGNKKIVFNSYFHKGHIMCSYNSSFPEKIATPVFDTSFPALQGASGAPVINEENFDVLGMLVANHERHLIPAQTVRVKDGEENFEEIKYFLPLGKAIQGGVIVEFLNSIGINM